LSLARSPKRGWRGVNNPYVTVEPPPGIQIPQAIITHLNAKPLKWSLVFETGTRVDPYLTLYEKNTAGKELDFTNDIDTKEDYIRYAVELLCLNPVADTRKIPLPP